MKKILIEDDEEMEYLLMALKPMKRKAQKILTITKCYHKSVEYIKIRYVGFDGLIDDWYFPSYGRRRRKMYKGMELDRDYTSEELGL